MKWIKVSERQPSLKVVDVYHVNVKYLDMDDSILMPYSCAFSGEWETKDNVEVVEWLDESPPVVQTDADGWISVEDRLPEDLQDVNVLLKNNKVKTDFVMTIDDKGQRVFKYYGDQVISWQPLPKAPTIHQK